MDAEARLNELLEEMCDQIGGDGIHAYNDQGERDGAMFFDIDDPRKSSEEQEAHTTAEERPRWSPDALDDGADAGKVKQEAGGGK